VDYPHVRLSAFYAVYFAILGVLLPFWPLYLSDLGLSVAQIGTLMAVLMLTRIVSPFIWGKLGDSLDNRMRVIQWGSGAAALCFIGVFWDQSFGWLVLVVAGYSFFWNAILPQFEVVTLDYLGDAHHHYSRVRAWGSVGFIGAAVGLGWYFNFASITHVPFILAACFISLTVLSWTIPGLVTHRADKAVKPSISVLLNSSFVSFLVACLLIQLAHAPYYTYFSLYVEQAGYSKGATGFYWALGAISEMILFMFMHRLLPRIGTFRLFVVALVASLVRWILLDIWVASPAALFFIQVLHAGTFGAFHAASIDFLRKHVPIGLSGQGQALYSMISYGVGGAVGSFLSAWIWPMSPTWAFWMASAISAVALGITFRWVART